MSSKVPIIVIVRRNLNAPAKYPFLGIPGEAVDNVERVDYMWTAQKHILYEQQLKRESCFFYYTQMEIKLLKTVEFGYSASHHRT